MGRGQNDGRGQPPAPRKRALPAWKRRHDDGDEVASYATWDGEEFSRVYGDHDEEQTDTRRPTVVIPALTLPSVSAVRRPPVGNHPELDEDYDDDAPARRRGHEDRRLAPSKQSDLAQRKVALAPTGKKPQVPPGVNVTLVPGGAPQRHGIRYRVRIAAKRLERPLHVVRTHRKALTIFALALMLTGVLLNTTGLLSNAGLLSAGRWNALASFGGPAPTPTPNPAPDFTDPGHYAAKYGFDMPGPSSALSSVEFTRLAFMLPFAYKATAAYDRRYHQSVEPEMLVWWTHAEGIKGRINYSNCANNAPRAGYDYFSNIQNCPHSSFWQLGYGNQFSVIYVLKNAFSDLYGDPNDPQLVQKVGQWVLNYDRSQGTVPTCGGYSCTFPAQTIDAIMSGIDTTTGVQTEDNWWASVLSRDPAINCYMIAHALTFFNHEATRRWIGCYYYEPCWGYESNKLGDILAAWPALRRAAHL